MFSPVFPERSGIPMAFRQALCCRDGPCVGGASPLRLEGWRGSREDAGRWSMGGHRVTGGASGPPGHRWPMIHDMGGSINGVPLDRNGLFISWKILGFCQPFNIKVKQRSCWIGTILTYQLGCTTPHHSHVYLPWNQYVLFYFRIYTNHLQHFACKQGSLPNNMERWPTVCPTFIKVGWNSVCSPTFRLDMIGYCKPWKGSNLWFGLICWPILYDFLAHKTIEISRPAIDTCFFLEQDWVRRAPICWPYLP